MRPAFFYIILYFTTIIAFGAVSSDFAKAVSSGHAITVTAQVDETISYITELDTTTISTNSPTGFILLGDNVYVHTLHPDSIEIKSPNQTFSLSANY